MGKKDSLSVSGAGKTGWHMWILNGVFLHPYKINWMYGKILSISLETTILKKIRNNTVAKLPQYFLGSGL